MTLLRDRRAEFEQAGVRPFGISRDSPWSHIAWKAALGIDVTLLSDWDGEAVRAFGVARGFRGLTDVAERSAFLVGPDGRIAGARSYEIDEVPDFDELLRAARSL